MLNLQKKSSNSENPIKETEFSTFPQKNLVVASTEFALYALYLGVPDFKGTAYIPNFSPKIGLEYSYKAISIKVALPIPHRESEIYRRGDSREKSFTATQNWSNFGFNLYYQSYRGLYAHNPLSDFSGNRPARFPQLPDAFVVNAGFNGYWVMNPKNFTLGFSGGYGYAYIRGRFFAVGQFVTGVGVQYQRTKELTQETIESYAPAVLANANFSVGVKTASRVGGAKLLLHTVGSRIIDVQVSSTMVSGQFFMV